MSTAIDLRLRDGIETARYAEIYARDGVVQVPDVLAPDAADAIATLLERSMPWRLVYTPGGREPRLLTQAELAALDRSGREALLNEINALARRNLGYAYSCYPMIMAYLEGWDPGHPIHVVTEYLNGPDFLALGAEIIGCPGVNKAEAQATLYKPGHFLTRHIDTGSENERRCAYTLGFCRRWEPDWGGLLVFLDERLDVMRGLTPRWNTLTLFRQDLVHCVTQVSTFAGAGRYVISGWLRDDPAPGH